MVREKNMRPKRLNHKTAGMKFSAPHPVFKSEDKTIQYIRGGVCVISDCKFRRTNQLHSGSEDALQETLKVVLPEKFFPYFEVTGRLNPSGNFVPEHEVLPDDLKGRILICTRHFFRSDTKYFNSFGTLPSNAMIDAKILTRGKQNQRQLPPINYSNPKKRGSQYYCGLEVCRGAIQNCLVCFIDATTCNHSYFD